MGKMEKIAKAVEKKNEGPVVKLLHAKEKDVQIAAIAAAGKIGKDDSFNALIVLLDSGDAEIRGAAVAALGEMGNDHARAYLQHALERETNEKVTASLKKAIERLRNARD